MKKKKALITGVAGQDGAYLAKLLLDKGYIVFGGKRKNSKNNLWRLKELNIEKDIKVITFDLSENNSIFKAIRNSNYNEIYNLAAQSFVDKSFDSPVLTADINSLGVIRILEAIRKFSPKTRLYQASSSEMFGNVKSRRQNEKTNFEPVSPYAVSKLHSHWMINVYRNAYNLYCCSGILFNHTSPLRGNEFVTKKIIGDLIKVKFKIIPCVILGNIHVRRDWGYSQDYVEAMWKMLQQKKAEDFIISSGTTHTVKDFINKVAEYLEMDIFWQGKGLNENAIDKTTGNIIVKTDRKFFRPNDINHTYGNSHKAKKVLNWRPKTNFNSIVKLMCDDELKKYK